MAKQGRNDPCACGSGRKFKHCCALLPVSAPIAVADQVGALPQSGEDIALLVARADAAFHEGRLLEAQIDLQRAVMLAPQNADALGNLGVVLSKQGKQDEAVEYFRRALQSSPNHVEVLANLALTLNQLGQIDESIALYHRVLALRPSHVNTLNNLGSALFMKGQTDEAVALWRRAHTADPKDESAMTNLGLGLKEQGDLDAAMDLFNRAIALYPTACAAYTNLFFALQFNPRSTLEDLHAVWRRYAAQFETPFKRQDAFRRHRREPSKRLKIGYVSADFRQHAVAHYIEPILAHHDREQVQVFCYYNNGNGDAVTERLQRYADVFLNCKYLTDEQLAECVRIHEVDILVDLAGHTAGNRLPMFAHKPAPIQMSFLGYPGTTGLSSVDYLLTDAHTDPEGCEDWYTEQLLRIDGSHFCYRPADAASAISALPALSNGHITFASFSNVNKIDDETLVLWSRLLLAVVDSHLLMVTVEAGPTRKRLIARFAALGISSDRLTFKGKLPGEAFRNMMQSADIALDPVSINSPTTMCETLWMGLPTVSLVGQRAPSRTGLSVLQAAGLGRYAASSAEEYIDIAASLARDVHALAQLRETQRGLLTQSTLMDEVGFTRKLEALYRQVWTQWCGAAQ